MPDENAFYEQVEDVWFTVPVCVTVNLTTGEVERVVVLDECAVCSEEDNYGTSEEALAIAKDSEVEWPGWEMGY